MIEGNAQTSLTYTLMPKQSVILNYLQMCLPSYALFQQTVTIALQKP